MKACAELSDLQEGRQIHDDIVSGGFELDLCVGNSLVPMYAKCGKIVIARHVFDKMCKRDEVSWNALIVGCTQNGYDSKALTLFDQMQMEGLEPDQVNVMSALQACAHLGALQRGRWIHDHIIRSRFVSDVSVMNSLVAMYAKCGSLTVACQLFDEMPKTDLVSWNAMIGGYAQNGYAEEALTLFHMMQSADVLPSSVTMEFATSMCSFSCSAKRKP